MPCRDGSGDCGRRPEDQREIDKLTDLLCSVLKIMERDNGKWSFLDPGCDVGIWWNNHKSKDIERIAREEKEKKESAIREIARKHKEILLLEKKLKQLKKSL